MIQASVRAHGSQEQFPFPGFGAPGGLPNLSFPFPMPSATAAPAGPPKKFALHTDTQFSGDGADQMLTLFDHGCERTEGRQVCTLEEGRGVNITMARGINATLDESSTLTLRIGGGVQGNIPMLLQTLIPQGERPIFELTCPVCGNLCVIDPSKALPGTMVTMSLIVPMLPHDLQTQLQSFLHAPIAIPMPACPFVLSPSATAAMPLQVPAELFNTAQMPQPLLHFLDTIKFMGNMEMDINHNGSKLFGLAGKFNFGWN